MFIYIERKMINVETGEYIAFSKVMNKEDVEDYMLQCVLHDDTSQMAEVTESVMRIEDGDHFTHVYDEYCVTIYYIEEGN